jgi:hypothetical protein
MVLKLTGERGYMGQNNRTFKAKHKEPFNADSATIIHGEGSVVIDFKQTTPRVDQVEENTEHTVITEHDAIVLQPQMAKVLLNLLEENIENYEEKFGEIELPDAEEQQVDASEEDTHGYIG